MRVTQTVSILTLAATALAAPHHWRWGGDRGRGKGHGQQQGQQQAVPEGVTIVYVDQHGNRLEGYTPPQPVVVTTTKAAAQPVVTRPPKVERPRPQPQPQPEPEPEPQPDNQNDTPNYGGGNGGGGGSSNSDYISIVNSWRAKLAKPLGPLTVDPDLERNALQTANEWSAKGHQLFPPSRAQVMAPGNPDNFESTFVGAWLCELPGLFANGECGEWTGPWDHSGGDTLHAKILSGDLVKIGCALGSGNWICDLGA